LPCAATNPSSANPQLEKIGTLAERYFSDDPIASLITVRQFGEALARQLSPTADVPSHTSGAAMCHFRP
jgi:hypothetical protein